MSPQSREVAARPGGTVRLEEALAAYVASLASPRLDERRLNALLDRLGLRGRAPVTLAEAGRAAGLSGERVRQLEARLRHQHASASSLSPPPELDAALAAVARAVPLPASDVGRVLADAGLTAGSFSAESLCGAAELTGRPLPFVVTGTGPHTVLLPRMAAGAVAHAGIIVARARRQTERCGASTVVELEQELADEKILVSRRQLRTVLEITPSVVVRRDGWFWFTDAGAAGTFVRATSRMLAVTRPLPVASLHDGLRRHNAFRRLPPPPPVRVLAEVYRSHGSFVLDGRLVSPVQAVDASLIGPLNRHMVEILRSAPGQVLPRSEFLDACHRQGLNLASVNLYTTYSECLERVAPGIFAARGTVVAPDVAQTAPRRRDDARRGEDRTTFGLLPDGSPWLEGRVTPSTWANGVVHVPAGLRPLVEARHFTYTGADGAPTTRLGIDRHGNSWGWTAFLRRTGAEPGDLIRATFDLATGSVALDLLRESERSISA